MTEKPLIILASARKQGKTRTFLNEVFSGSDYDLVDLLDFHILPYNYANDYSDTDEFLKIVDELLGHRIIVFATPVYWYAMSGLMKTFFDRFTDIVTAKKQIGRQLSGKSTFLLAVGADEELPGGFEVPFKSTSDYLDMEYRGCIYYSTKFPKTEEKVREIIRVFKDKLNALTANIGLVMWQPPPG